MKTKAIFSAFTLFVMMSCGSANNATNDNDNNKNLEGDSLPRTECPAELNDSAKSFLAGMEAQSLDMHSVMIVQHGKVLYEHWQSEGKPDEPHVLNSVSKTFTSIAVGMAVEEGKIKLEDKLISYFPENLPKTSSKNLENIKVRDLLTMTCGHDTDHTGEMQKMDSTINWVSQFLSYPVEHIPGSYYCYNSVGTFMLSAIVQKVTGQTLDEYLKPRLFEPLAIKNVRWDTNPQGICYGGWGLFLVTEDLAKVGQLILQKGKWNGKQLISEKWVTEMTGRQTDSRQAGMTAEEMVLAGMTIENCDWLQGYGYQMWRCRNNAVRADGARGQYIIVMPDQDAVISMTSMIENADMQKQLNLVWNHLLPALDANK